MDRTEALRRALLEHAFIRSRNGSPTIATEIQGRYAPWMFDCRPLLLQSRWLDAYADIFWERYGHLYPFQVGGMETVGIVLISAIVMKGAERGTPINGFFIRKSRRRSGLMKVIEGTVTDDPIILVDDVVNSGTSFEKQAALLREIGKDVACFFALVAYRSPSFYFALTKEGAQLDSLFSLTDFGEPLLSGPQPNEVATLTTRWRFDGGHPSFDLVTHKSSPALDDEKVYFGCDDGQFRALYQRSGDVAWTFRIGAHSSGKGILSSSAIHKRRVYFGAYDGCVYALDTATGACQWRYDEAEWVGSSPALAPDLGLLFIGLEFGLFRKQGGIAALSLTTGKRLWMQRLGAFTHSSPCYLPSKKLVVVGSNDGTVCAYDAKTGALRWQHQAEAQVAMSFNYDPKTDSVVFGSMNGALYAVSAADGSLRFSYATDAGIYATPLVVHDLVYVPSLDRHLYAIDLTTGKKRWEYDTGGRVFFSPGYSDHSIWVGSNSGALAELDPQNGALRSIFRTTERIVGRMAHNPKTGHFFIVTVANQLYCLERAAASTDA